MSSSLLHNQRLPRGFAGILLLVLWGCGPSADAPLPPESDLYAYSLAVAERARALVPAASAKAIYHVGRVHERFGLEDRALEHYREAIAEDPNLTGPYLRTGFILSQRKDRMDEGVVAYQQALRSDPLARGVYTRLGLVYAHQGKLDEALRALDQEIRLGSADEDTHYNMGLALALQGKHAEAIAAFGEAIKLSPAMRSAHYSMAQSLRAAGRLDEEKRALETFRQIKKAEDEADSRAPKDERAAKVRLAAETWMDAAEVFVDEVNRTKEAREQPRYRAEFRKAVEQATRLDPRNVEARQVLIDYHRNANDLGLAAAVCEGALKEIPGERSLAQAAFDVAGKCLEAARGAASPASWVDLAERLLQASIASVPEFDDGHRELARLMLFWRMDRQDNLPRALAHAREALKLSPGPENYDILAFAYMRSGQRDAALKTLEMGVREHPGNEVLKERWQKLNEAGTAPGGAQPAGAGRESP